MFIIVCIAFYVLTGVFISIKTFKHVLGKILGMFYFGLLWGPILLADVIVNRMYNNSM